ncbi:CBS domain-containing protein [Paracoccus shanxieyensis]|uniref:CBS domain-containing protein n=1 Tax=Paracoccus shanxieyensis TaxID=2675752 RepID=A0A6L6IUX9_9RHOB|nr:hemolysin family protein [Paracoccus shanxieyensis]MTH63431.1 CBS domain-containing protein [Paracoccus shanxieyensis]MTH86352.1 CBS domain-containing protein [Paracoccus shanxieyensis]
MTNDRSPDTSVAAEPASWADGTSGDGRDAPQQRGFLGRLLGAFGAGDAEGEGAGQAEDQDKSDNGAPGIGNLRRMRVDDVLIPKAEIVAAASTSTLPELVEMFREHGFSRIPVYRGTLDTPLGLIHLKDLALKHGFGSDAPAFALRPMLRPLLYVPPSMSIGVLLAQMQQKRIHMALVIDEYGGVDGLVTIEDLIEQVIGAIEDEHDEIEDGLMVPEAPGRWMIQSRVPLEAVERETGLRLSSEDDEIDTLGGLIFMLTGRVPAVGEIIPHDSGAEFEILETDPRRVRRLRLRVPAQEVSA